jgi:uncharacterized protein YbjT (DUF2867 family)
MATVVVFGGSGFLGRRLVRRLAGDGSNVRVAVRHPAPARSVLEAAGLDRVAVQRADVSDQTSVAAVVAGAEAVVNAVSAYVERGGATFEAVHVRGAETVAQESAAAGVARLVLVSGIGADSGSRSPYIRARGRGELAVQRAFPSATIVRPSAMFGPGDALFGTLAALARRLPALAAPACNRSMSRTSRRPSSAYSPTPRPPAGPTSSLGLACTRCANWSGSRCTSSAEGGCSRRCPSRQPMFWRACSSFCPARR